MSHNLSAQGLNYLLREEFKGAANRDNIFILDRTYSRPKSSSLGGWGRWARYMLAGFGITAWKQFFDCDNFSIWFWACAHVMHHKAVATNPILGEGVAIGIIAFRQDSGGGHMINVVVTEKGVEKYEPQTRQVVKLSQQEKDSAWLVVV